MKPTPAELRAQVRARDAQLDALTQAQIEALCAHELAALRRTKEEDERKEARR